MSHATMQIIQVMLKIPSIKRFHAVTYPSFQPMIEAISQYGVGVKGPTLHEVRVTNLKKELALTKDLMKYHMVEWKKNGCSIMSNGWTDRKERTLVNFLVNCSKGTMFMQSIDASSMIKMREKMFELLKKWVDVDPQFCLPSTCSIKYLFGTL